MTVKLYADRKGWPVEKVDVSVRGEKTPEGFVITRDITLTGALDEEQRTRLLAIANKCPVHKTLSGTITINSRLI